MLAESFKYLKLQYQNSLVLIELFDHNYYQV